MRRTNGERLEEIYRNAELEPGIRAGRVAAKLDIPRSSVMRALPALEEQGLLLSEDARGRLWPWGRRG